jgi:hypothetical protein
MFVNPCFYFEELFPVVAPGEESGVLDEAARPADTAALPPGASDVPQAEDAACSQ